MASNAPVRPSKKGGNQKALAVSDILEGKMLYTGKFKTADWASLMVWETADTISSGESVVSNPSYLQLYHTIDETGALNKTVVTTTEKTEFVYENIIETADINGDGFTDLIVRDEANSGYAPVAVWYMKDGVIDSKDENFGYVSAGDNKDLWDIVVNGSGDFNGDGRDDLLLQDHASGQLVAWISTEDGGHRNSAGGNGLLTSDWSVIGSGDFNGDGQDDILIRNTNESSSGYGDIFVFGQNSEGSIDTNLITYLGRATAGWEVAGIGNFDGNKCDDILFVYQGTEGSTSAGADAGAVVAWMMDDNWIGWGYDWESDPTGADWSANRASYFGGLERSFGLVSADDFNGDGIDDIALANVDDQSVYAWITDKNNGNPTIASVIALG